MPGEVESSGEKRGLVYRSSHHPGDVTTERHVCSALYREARQPSCKGCIALRGPFADSFIDVHAASLRSDDHEIRAPANPWVGERLPNYLRSYSPGVTRGDRDAPRHASESNRDEDLLA
jgi:hypothetical protein